MIKVKPGVQPRLVHLVAGVANAAFAAGLDEVWITSAMDSIHAPDSLHYALRALDLRTHNLTSEQVARLMAELAKALGPSADIIWEARGTPNSHLHVEFDPD